jgi:glycosyltransferase involved in cell wall biosynthesis
MDNLLRATEEVVLDDTDKKICDRSNTLSLVIPIYNEASHLERFLEAIDGQDFGVATELIFIDDKSADGSAELLKDFKFRRPVRIIQQEKNCGKGAALRRGIEAATGDIIGIQDADFEYDYSEIPSIVVPILEGRADVSYGSRFKSGD